MSARRPHTESQPRSSNHFAPVTHSSRPFQPPSATAPLPPRLAAGHRRTGRPSLPREPNRI
nr:unnamed protein product [Digitaria exilis]